MQATTFGFERPDGVVLFVYRWLPNGSAKAVVQIAHGWGEHAGRYARVAEALCREGYGVYADDHRGHGRAARTPAELGFFAERDGWNNCVRDLWRLHQHIAASQRGAPIVSILAMTPRRAASRLAVAGPLAPRSRHCRSDREPGFGGMRCGHSIYETLERYLTSGTPIAPIARRTRTQVLLRQRNARSMESILKRRNASQS